MKTRVPSLESISDPHKSEKQEMEKGVRIFVHGLHPFTSKKDIIDGFSNTAAIYDVEFKSDRKTGKHRGYAFFSVRSKDIAERLIQKSHLIYGRKVHCDFKQVALENKIQNQKRRLFVGGLQSWATDQQITSFFENYGPVRAAYSIKTLDGRSKGFGYVDFENVSTANKVLEETELVFYGRAIEVRPYKGRARKNKNTRENNSPNHWGGTRSSFGQEEPNGAMQTHDYSQYCNQQIRQNDSFFQTEETNNMTNYQNVELKGANPVQNFARNTPGPLRCFMNCRGEKVIEMLHRVNSLMMLGEYKKAAGVFNQANYFLGNSGISI